MHSERTSEPHPRVLGQPRRLWDACYYGYDDILRPFMKVTKVSEMPTASGESDGLISRRRNRKAQANNLNQKKKKKEHLKKKAKLSLKPFFFMHLNIKICCWCTVDNRPRRWLIEFNHLATFFLKESLTLSWEVLGANLSICLTLLNCLLPI